MFTQFEPYRQVKVLVFDLDLSLVEAARDATARFSETAASGCSLSCPRAEVAKVNTTLVTCLSDDESYVSLHDFCFQMKYVFRFKRPLDGVPNNATGEREDAMGTHGRENVSS